MTFETIDQNLQTSQELDYRLLTISKNNLSEIHISRPTPQDPLSVQLFSLGYGNYSTCVAHSSF